MSDFNLSKNIFTANNKSKTFIELYNLEIILKEFIKKLKEVCGCGNCKQYVKNDIDKLAGDDLK